MKNTKNKALAVALGLGLGVVVANADESNIDSNAVAEHFKKNYSYNAQVGAQYTQGYYGGSKNNFQSLYAYLGFEGVEFERLRFGLNLMGSVKLGTSNAIYAQDIANANAMLYQAYLGYTSKYFDISGGREEVDLEWISDYIEGGRFAVKIPQGATEIKGYWFYRQGDVAYNEISQFEDGRVGHTFAVGIENNAWQPLAIKAYFMDISSKSNIPSFNGAWVGANLAFGSDDFILSNTNIKYSYFHSKVADFVDTQFLQVEEDLTFNVADSHNIGLKVGISKVFNQKNGNAIEFNAIGDNNPFEQGDQLYLSNALTAYAGLSYNFVDYLEIAFLYGNTSGAKNGATKPINEINLGATGHYKGFELGFIYSKLLGNDNFNSKDLHNTKLNQDYFEAHFAYNF